MDFIENAIGWVNGIVWGIPMLALLLFTGLYLSFGLRGLSIFRVPYAFGQLFKKRESKKEEGDVSPFAALMTALSSTIGTGNIAGVAAAIAIGGPGAIFWMWVTAIVGTATKFSEGVLAVRFREVDTNGKRVGGPMYYIKNGLGGKWIYLAFAFAFFGMIAAWGTGAMIQSNSVADALNNTYDVPHVFTALVLAAGAAAVIIGGIERIGIVASAVVPFMALAYVGAGLLILLLNASEIPGAFGMIFRGAFGLDSAGTGITMGLLLLAMQKGVARGIFSNEAGQGSAPIAHAAAQNNDPVNQGLIAMLGTVIDTLIVCTITALIILTSGVFGTECIPTSLNLETFLADTQPAGCETAAPLTIQAFDATLTGWGEHIVTLGLCVFAFTTILGWSYYGERCAAFLFSEKVILPYRISWVVVVFLGSALLAFEDQVGNIVNLFWLVADTLTGLMAAPNLIALALLSPVVFKMAKEYFSGDTRGLNTDDAS